MPLELSTSQIQRMKELGIESEFDSFNSIYERNRLFENAVKAATKCQRELLRQKYSQKKRHSVKELECIIVSHLINLGFLECYTPMIISKDSLYKMNLSEEHPLWKQVFWLDSGHCLRPMLAPNLYCIMHHLKRNLKSPVRIFEVGPCFRKESKGCSHLEEFTMLNMVEMEPEISPIDRLSDLIAIVMEPLGLNYELTHEESEVYGVTIDVVVNGVEVASASYGPHSLDHANGINVPWAGVGFGIERLAQLINGDRNIKRVGRSLIYLDGVRLDI